MALTSYRVVATDIDIIADKLLGASVEAAIHDDIALAI
jgi:hypothetical protein